MSQAASESVVPLRIGAAGAPQPTAHHPLRGARTGRLSSFALTLAFGASLSCQAELQGAVPESEAFGPDGRGPGQTPSGAPDHGCGAPAQRIWKLTPAQLSRSLQQLLPGGDDIEQELAATLASSEAGFSNEAARLDMSELHVEALFETARRVAAKAAADPAALSGCLATGPISSECAASFVADFGARAFRRPLEPEEQQQHVSAFTERQAAHGDETALALTLRSFLLSPQFLYRTELGAPGAAKPQLTSHERASALSFLIGDGPPDAELMRAAGAGELDNSNGMVAQARRLLTAGGAGGVLRFFTENFGTDRVRFSIKDSALFPDFDESLADAMAAESERFIRAVLFEEDARWSTLLTAEFSFLNERLAQHYGAGAVSGSELLRTPLPAGQRAGILTQASVLSFLARENDSDAVKRGKFVRETLLCQPLPPPPASVNAVPPPPDGVHTQRERLAQHSTDATCAGCHAQIDPLGFPFERYDGIGRYRTQDAGKTIDASGTLSGVSAGTLEFSDALQLAQLLSELPEARECIARHLHAYAFGRQRQAAYGCAPAAAVTSFEQSDGDLLETALAIVADPAFVERVKP
jgi:hypothetical protein